MSGKDRSLISTAKMKFKKGSKVEVLDEREVPSGSWCCAEIVSGNGRYYSVKYDSFSEGTGVTVEKVPRKAIRPCPPMVKSPRCWVDGDIVEVYEKNSWKVAEVLRVVGRTGFLVRLLGSSRKLRAHISDLRMRLVWEDDKWVVIQKEPRECDIGNTNNLSKAVEFSDQMPLSCVEVKTCRGDDQILNKHDGSLEELCWVPLGRKRRRSFLDSPQIDSCPSACKEMRSVEETERKCRLLETLPSHLLRKAQVRDLYSLLHVQSEGGLCHLSYLLDSFMTFVSDSGQQQEDKLVLGIPFSFLFGNGFVQ